MAISSVPIDTIVKAKVDAAICINSLDRAIQQAGGTVFGIDRLSKMTVLEFITEVAAQNHIRFVYEPQNNNE